jgi:hypothetical protein
MTPWFSPTFGDEARILDDPTGGPGPTVAAQFLLATRDITTYRL